jgi:hypothetical protein
MGLKDWIARRGNIGGVARAVGKAWKNLHAANPEMSPQELVTAYIKFRYKIFAESNLEAEALELARMGRIEDPLGLSWLILEVENKNDLETLRRDERKWKQIMYEELVKQGVEPGQMRVWRDYWP